MAFPLAFSEGVAAAAAGVMMLPVTASAATPRARAVFTERMVSPHRCDMRCMARRSGFFTLFTRHPRGEPDTAPEGDVCSLAYRSFADIC
ncbi:hypothetical protein GCM10010219_13360 [Streptomyces netropsis]|nr:hypothetical protein GCM10010219_13360 [Streptomyces netropsis]